MPTPPTKLKEDYLHLLEDPRPLQELGLVCDLAAMREIRPFAGMDMRKPWAQLQLESMLVAAMDGDKPLDPAGEFLEAVVQSGGSEQTWLDPLVEQLICAVDRIRKRFPMPYLVGDFPLSYPFNAATVLRPEGALVLINRGLTDLIWFAANLFAARTHIVIGDEYATVGTIKPLPFSKEEVDNSLAKVVLAYLQHKNAHVAGHLLPWFGHARTTVVGCLLNECTKFVVAHEFAHIISGHLTQEVTKASPSAGDDPFAKLASHVLGSLEHGGRTVRLTHRSSPLISLRWAQEMGADFLALYILFSSLGSAKGDGRVCIDPREPLFEFTVTAPLFDFCLSRLISDAETARRGCRGKILLTDHPPTELRERVVQMVYEDWGFRNLPRLTQETVKWFAGIHESVVEAVSRLLQ